MRERVGGRLERGENDFSSRLLSPPENACLVLVVCLPRKIPDVKVLFYIERFTLNFSAALAKTN